MILFSLMTPNGERKAVRGDYVTMTVDKIYIFDAAGECVYTLYHPSAIIGPGVSNQECWVGFDKPTSRPEPVQYIEIVEDH